MQTPSSESNDEPTSYGRCTEITPEMRAAAARELIRRINASTQNLTNLLKRQEAGEDIYFVAVNSYWLDDANKI